MNNGSIIKMIVLVPGIAIPEKMGFILHYCNPAGHTKEAINAGHLIRIDYHPPYIEFECVNPGQILKLALEKGLRVYRGKKHITITDGVYSVRIYKTRASGESS